MIFVLILVIGTLAEMLSGFLDAVINGAGIIKVALFPDAVCSEAEVVSKMRRDAKAVFSRAKIRIRMLKRIFEFLKEERMSAVQFGFPNSNDYSFINFLNNSSISYKIKEGRYCSIGSLADAFDYLANDRTAISEILDMIIDGKFEVNSKININDEKWEKTIKEVFNEN